jgi:hypothetical protein
VARIDPAPTPSSAPYIRRFVGGTFQSHDWSTDPDPKTVSEKLAALRAVYRQL